MIRRNIQLGITLIELMVAMAIGVVVMLVVYQLFAVSESTRRTSVAGSDAQMSAAIAVSALQDQIRNGGYGLVGITSTTSKPQSSRILGCFVRGFDARAGGGPISFTLAPVVILQGADNNAAGNGTDSDTIRIVYSDLDYPTVPVNLLSGMLNPTADLKVTNRYGVKPGHVAMLVSTPADVTPPVLAASPAAAQQIIPPQAPTYVPPGYVCGLGEVNGTPNIPGQLDVVQHGNGAYLDPETNANTMPRFNGAAGFGNGGWQFASSASLFNFGKNPSVVTFSVQNNQLMMVNLLGSGTTTPAAQAMVDGVVSLQAQYGVAVDNVDNSTGIAPPDGMADPGVGVSTWTTDVTQIPRWPNPYAADPNLSNATKWGTVVAIRFAVLTRSGQMERKDSSNNCTATPATSPELTWSGGTFDVSNITDWQCYRYKKFEAVVPLRNIIWMPTS